CAMKRRNFLQSVSALPAMLALPFFGLPFAKHVMPGAAQDTVDAGLVEVPAEVTYFEAMIANLNGKFSRYAHNELRHHYRSISPKRSMMHSDIILANSLMDHYVLQTLSEWHMDNAPIQAVGQLFDKAETFSNLVHLRAACLIQSGHLMRRIGK